MHSRRFFVLAATIVAIGAVALGGAAPSGAMSSAPSAPSAACSGATGVTVVVDFGPLGGGTHIRCAPGSPSSGLAALQAAGFSYGFVDGQPGLVCTIDNAPDPCNGSPADAYWSYHHASRGGSWKYSNQGAGTYRPPPGSVEGWAFGDDREPSAAPPAPTPSTTASTAPPPTAPPTSRPPATVAPSTTAAGSATPVPDGGAGDDPPTDPSEPTDEASTSTTVATTTTAGETTTTESAVIEESAADVALETASSRDEDQGVGAGALLGVAAVAAVAGGAAFELRRRRSGP